MNLLIVPPNKQIYQNLLRDGNHFLEKWKNYSFNEVQFAKDGWRSHLSIFTEFIWERHSYYSTCEKNNCALTRRILDSQPQCWMNTEKYSFHNHERKEMKVIWEVALCEFCFKLSKNFTAKMLGSRKQHESSEIYKACIYKWSYEF